MIDFVIILIITLLIGLSIAYIRKEKKKGVRCIGCSLAGSCQSNSCSKVNIKEAYYKDKDL